MSFIPCTPAGTMVVNLAAPTREEAIRRLLMCRSLVQILTVKNAFVRRVFHYLPGFISDRPSIYA